MRKSFFYLTAVQAKPMKKRQDKAQVDLLRERSAELRAELLVWIIGSRKEKYKKEKQVQSIIIIMSHHKGYPVPRAKLKKKTRK